MELSRTLGRQDNLGPWHVNRGWSGLLALLILGAAPAVALAKPKPAVIQIYNGIGTPAKAALWGRVIEDEGEPPEGKGDSWGRKLKRNLKALESDEIPHAKLEIEVLGKRLGAQADEEGLFELEVPGPLPPGAHAVSARLTGDDRKSRSAPGRLLVHAPGKAPVAVLSDIDDTVLDTGVTSKLKLVKRVLLTNAADLKTFAGAPALYRAWSKRGYPLVFVSGSPVNLYPKLTRFLELKGFPEAALLLKDFSLGDMTQQKGYKLGQIAKVLRLLPGYRFLLVGDDGEQDPQVYAEVQRQHPARVTAVMIHRVAKARPELPKGQIGFETYAELGKLLQTKKLLTAEERGAVEKGP